jgi:ribosomal protein S12 methylthiotransferase accessory factor
MTHMQARISCLAEALEHFGFMQERPPDAVRERMRDLGDEAIDPRTVMLYSDRQYERASRADALLTPFERVPEKRFDPDETIGWTFGWSLTGKRTRLIPSDLCWMTDAETRDSSFCMPDANGCAAGNCLEEALLQGLYELVERDAVAIWWYNRIRRQQVDLNAFGDSAVKAICEHHRSVLKRDMHVLDITPDLGIPVFAAISRRRDSTRPESVFSFGCHADPRLALRRAVTEMCQCMVWWKQFLTTPDNPEPWQSARRVASPAIESWIRRVPADQQAHLIPSMHMPARRPADFGAGCFGNLSEEISWCVERLATAGIEVVAVDATRPDLDIALVRVFAPGLRHFWRRLAAGRLYDVPVALGWRDTARTEEEMNPISMFL